MRVAFVGPYPYEPDVRFTGAQVVTANLARALHGRGDLDVQVVSCVRDVEAPVEADRNGLRVHYVPASRRLGNLTLRIAQGRRIADKIRELSPDIAHFQLHFEYPYLFGPPPCPCLATVHGIVYREVEFGSGLRHRLRRGPRIWLERLTLARLNHLICVTDYVGDAVRHLTHAQLVTIYNPIPDHFFELTAESDAPAVLFVGSIEERKNVTGLVLAFAPVARELPGARLRLVGPVVDPSYLTRLRELIAAEGVEKQVELLGRLSEGPLLEEYQRCTVVASASSEETAGLVFQQGLAAGVPAVGAEVGGVPEIIEDGVTGFVVPLHDRDAFADRLLRILTDDVLRTRMGAAARASSGRFRTEDVADRTAEMYTRIVEANREEVLR